MGFVCTIFVYVSSPRAYFRVGCTEHNYFDFRFFIFSPRASVRAGFLLLVFLFAAAPEWVLHISLYPYEVVFALYKPPSTLSGGMFALS